VENILKSKWPIEDESNAITELSSKDFWTILEMVINYLMAQSFGWIFVCSLLEHCQQMFFWWVALFQVDFVHMKQNFQCPISLFGWYVQRCKFKVDSHFKK